MAEISQETARAMLEAGRKLNSVEWLVKGADDGELVLVTVGTIRAIRAAIAAAEKEAAR